MGFEGATKWTGQGKYGKYRECGDEGWDFSGKAHVVGEVLRQFVDYGTIWSQ